MGTGSKNKFTLCEVGKSLQFLLGKLMHGNRQVEAKNKEEQV